jgi:hypothetical protein
METGQTITPTPACFGVTPVPNTNADVTSGVSGDGDVYQYNYAFTWGTDSDRCTEVTTLIASSTSGGIGATTTEAVVRSIIPGYPISAGDWGCEAGGRCTILSVRGYNKQCTATSTFGTVQREVLLQF